MLAIFIMCRSYFNTFEYSGEDAEVSLFPISADAKNYRLEATVTVNGRPSGLFGSRRVYNVDEVSWPNGGYSTFHNCTVGERQKAECEDKEGRKWKVEVTTEPTAPEAESSDGGGYEY